MKIIAPEKDAAIRVTSFSVCPSSSTKRHISMVVNNLAGDQAPVLKG